MYRILFFLLCIAISPRLAGQEVVFITQVPAQKMGINDAIQVSYVIQNAQEVSKFALINTDDFKVIGGPSQGQNFNMMNGEVSMSVSFTYVLQPKRKGKLEVPLGDAVVKNRRIKSNKVFLEVVDGSLAAKQSNQRRSGGPFDDFFRDDPFEEMRRHQEEFERRMRDAYQNDPRRKKSSRPKRPANTPDPNEPVTKSNIGDKIFIKVEVDKDEVSVGEQITASYKLYTKIPVQINLTRLPSLNNFWTQDFDIPQPPRPTREVLNGQEYQVFLIKKSALFPNQSGMLELDPAEGEGLARVRKNRTLRQRRSEDNSIAGALSSLLMDDPRFDEQYFLNDYEEVNVKLKSKPVNIKVNKIASNTIDKEHFKGAVGKYSLESMIDRTELSTDDVGTLTLTIRGSGNLKLISPPKVQFPKGCQVYKILEEDTITSRVNNKITGYKTFKYRFTPKANGELRIPAAKFSFYDPESGQFVTEKTPEYILAVKPNKRNQAIVALPDDIHDINPEEIVLKKDSSSSLPDKALYWGGFGAPLLAYVMLIFYKRKEDEVKQNKSLYKNKQANKAALKRLSSAQRSLKAGDQQKFYDDISKAVWLYLSDKLNIPISTLSKEMAGTLLRKRELSRELIDEVFLITDECELALYAADSGELKMNQLYSDSLNLLGKLEATLGS